MPVDGLRRWGDEVRLAIWKWVYGIEKEKEGLELYGEEADNGGERKDNACQKPVHVAAASFC